ncbi:Putative colanic biosynthesis UDP-glucose lipid carrier transferase [Dermatophilus congolensis]|uniref:Colanic biosynthesis UDP-glucose lipid carrier transferase n=1 Tax=Dermatophilus congolensis TaxID=1863 RepID=A0AA46BNY1_9MICO|nr:sugar transferase [Dermatophilus congolensis]STD11275.1 Putative colanic biosynthesis UDP-glucose lipid carrier transferase [Dermatophilus congolensis]
MTVENRSTRGWHRSGRRTSAKAEGETARLVLRDESDIPFAPSLGPVNTPAHAPGGEWARAYLLRLVAGDFVIGAAGAVAASVTRFGSEVTTGYWMATVAIPFVWVLALVMANAYERRFLGVSTEEYRSVGRATVGLLSVLAIGAFASNYPLARMWVFLMLPLLFAGGLAARWVMRRWLVRHRRVGELMQRTIVVGRADAAANLIRSIKSEPGQGLRPVAVCATGFDAEWDTTTSLEGVPVMGRPRDALAAADLYDAEVVVVASHPDLAGKSLRRLAWALEERGIELIVSPGLLDVAGPRLSIRPSTNLSLLHIERPAAARRSAILKGLMDCSLAALLLFLLSPLMVAIAVAIKVSDPGPVFFRQQRVGVRGKFFWIFKFRTMVVDAEKRLEALEARSDGNGVLFKMKDDPRITKIGHFLRRYSLDELPQLINVLIGDMSLVGPRPPLAREVEQYEPDALRRLHVKPGMTGLWQVSGRSDLSWEESLRLDLRYVDNWSPMGDLHILFRTFSAVFTSSGAY